MTFNVSADSYGRHVGRYSPALAAELVRVARVTPGARALDVGCGPGALAAHLAGVLGPEHVAAVDPSESFVEACRSRLSAADVRLADAEALPFADGSFDVVLSQLVVNFMSDPGQGIREMRRVARAGGAIAACVWDYAEGMTLLRTFWDAALEVDPDAPDEGLTMRYCREGELGGLWRDTGLTEVEDGALEVSATYASFDDLWSPLQDGVGPAGAYCVSLSADAQEALRDACFRRLSSPDGSFMLSARAWYAVGRV